MAVDFDFDGSFEDDENEDGVADEEINDEDEDQDEEPKRGGGLRRILLLLVVLLLGCVVCGFGAQQFGGADLVASIPFIGGGDPAPPPPPPPEAPAPAETTEAEAGTDENSEASALSAPESEEGGEEVATEEGAATTEEGADTSTTEGEADSNSTEESTDSTEMDEGSDETMAEEGSGDETTDGSGSEETTTDAAPEATAEPDDSSTDETAAEPTEEAMDDGEEGATTEPTVEATIEPAPTSEASCDNNQAPIANANGDYSAMRGKGQGVVVFDASGSEDPDGTIVSYEWDFGDGTDGGTGESVTYGYPTVGEYVATLVVTDNCGDVGFDTANVSITEAETPEETPTPESPQVNGTAGFCYQVQYGNTLSGIAWYYGLTLDDLAAVNGVDNEYFVIAGQGLFIPSGEIDGEPNVYLAQSGDTLSSIAYHCGLLTTVLADANSLEVTDTLTPGQAVVIPRWVDRDN